MNCKIMKYKVGDKVRIKSLDWYNQMLSIPSKIVAKGDFVAIECGAHIFTKEMSKFCGRVMTIQAIGIDFYIMDEDMLGYEFTDEMIEGLVEEESDITPKFKVGDKIKLKSTLLNDVFGIIGYESEGYRITNISNGLMYFMSYSIEHNYELVEEETKPKPKFMIGHKVILGSYPCIVTNVQWKDGYGFVYIVGGSDFSKIVKEDELVFDTNEERQNLLDKCEVEPYPKSITLPEDYEFRDENGNVINAQKIVLEKKKPKYPRSVEECCEILGYPVWGGDIGYKSSLLMKFQMLLICRDAYWKIAGEEMGLGKSWEPDWDNLSTNHEFIKINKGCFTYSSRVLVFPTAKMRDAFYEAFKDLIEECKELL